MPRLVLTLCGRVTVQVEGSPGDDVRPLGAKALALLAYLALQRVAQPRAGLAALLWSESDDAHARASLRQALLQLRRALGPVLDDEGAAVALAVAVDCDVAPLLDDATERPPALDVQRFLTELPLRDAPVFEAWAAGLRERLRSRMAGLLEQAVAQALAQRDTRAALDAATRWHALAPFDDAPVLALVRAHELAGQVAVALVVIDAHRRQLHDEDGRPPGPALAAAAERLARHAAAHASSCGTAEDGAASTAAGGAAGEPARDAIANALANAPLQEREAEWDAFVQAWRAASTGTGGMLLLEGEPGIGRTRLLRDWGSWVASDGGIVLHAPSLEADQRIPFGVVARLVRVALDADGAAGTDGRWLAELAWLDPTLRTRFPGVPDAESAAPTDGWRVFEAVAHLLGALTAEAPVLVVLDDLSWCDAESAGLLHALVERTRGAPLLWCAAASDGGGERDGAGTRLARALAAAGAAVVRPSRLGDRGVRGIIGALGEPTESADERARAAALVASVRAETEGSPHYVVALLRALHERGVLAVRAGRWTTLGAPGMALPARLADLPEVRVPLVARLDRVPEDARALLVTIALAALPCRPELLSHVHTISRLRAVALADALRTRGLVMEEHGAFRCAHRVVAAVVSTEASTAWCRETHRALADTLPLLTGSYAVPELMAAVAYHTRLAAESPTRSDVTPPPSPVSLPAPRPSADAFVANGGPANLVGRSGR